MSRSGYTDDYCFEQWNWIMWRGAVASALRGKRGQSFLIEMLTALEALPVKRLVAEELVEMDWVSFSHWGEHPVESVCAIGAVGRKRGIDMRALDPEDYLNVADKFGLARAMTREIVWINDEGGSHRETPEQRYARVHGWVRSQIREFAL